MRCRASEWSVPFRPGAALTEADGWERCRRSFAVLHDLVVEAADGNFANLPVGVAERSGREHVVVAHLARRHRADWCVRRAAGWRAAAVLTGCWW